jgi:uncharacterized DUF497 family protein
MALRFEWDEVKAAANVAKHGVSFDEGQTVFGDPCSITLFDHEHADAEDRFIDIGRSQAGRVLVVVYAETDERVRIISCRRARPREQRQYEARPT